jgi:nucleoside-diphosphate-sugar epimerase
MNILVIGGTRFFGKRLVRLLLQANHEVTILSRGQMADDFGDKVKRLVADRTNSSEMKAALDGKSFDAVVDQICMNGEQARIAVQLFKDKTDYYLYTSTLSVYALGSDLAETEFNALDYKTLRPTTPAEEYAEGKRAAEKVFLEQCFFATSFARFPVVVGDDDYTDRLLKHVCSVSRKEPIYFPNLKARFGLIQSSDAAKALQWMVENKKLGVFNFASPDPITLEELMSEISSVVGQEAIFAESGNSQNGSPYGVPQSWTMNVSKARAEGFECEPQAEWLRPLLVRLKEKCRSQNRH